jgi:2-dehydro-3-deoxyphosphooctonate aldolase (KDO 8-P synthase)
MNNGNLSFEPGRDFFLIAGPCVIESEEGALSLARSLSAMARELEIPLIFKASYDKANRSSIASFRGPGMKKGLEILARIKEKAGVAVMSDIHEPAQAEAAARVLDVLQIPAFLCRQTDLVTAAASTGRPINIKKGQFLAPWDMVNAVEKARTVGCRQILLTERGSCFGYNNLVNDMRSIPRMQSLGCPVVFDATHSVQKPGGLGHATGGEADMIPVLAQAAVAAGCDGIFFETHENPDEALSDGPNMIDLKTLKELLPRLLRIRSACGRSSGASTED